MLIRRDFLTRFALLGAFVSEFCVISTKRQPFLLSATVDFPDDVGQGPYNLELLDQLMGQLAQMGVRRVYWLYYGDIEPDSYWAGNLFDYMKYGQETLANLGEPVRAAVPVAHRHGLELYGVLKPYNTGISGTYPEGSPRAGATGITRIGGTLQQVIPFVERYPETRVLRRPWNPPDDLQKVPIRKIRLLKKDDSPTRVRAENLQIWTSPTNYRYQPRFKSDQMREEVTSADREVRDYYGNLLTAKGAPVRALTLEGLDLDYRYVLVTTDFQDRSGDFRNSAVAMIEAYGPGPDPLPIVVGSHSAIWTQPRSFRTGGLEFDLGLGPYEMTLDEDNHSSEGQGWARGGCVAFARGKNTHLPCTPCEVYPEVQKLWLGWIDRLVQAGVDGIDLRLSHHGSLTDEPFEYGFNEPVLQEYAKRHGEPAGGAYDLTLLSQIRGQHYSAFVGEASRRVRRAGGKMQVHLHAEAFRPDPCQGQLMGFPANVSFQWQDWLKSGLLDGATLRTSWFEAIEDPPGGAPHRSRLSNALDDPMVKEMLELTGELDLPVYLNRYVSRTVGIDEYVSDMKAVSGDPRFAGFDVYEMANVSRPDPQGTRLVPVERRLERIRRAARELGLETN